VKIMASRKTIEVERVKKQVNSMLLHTPDEMKAERRGMAMVLEHILHESENYRGFAYLGEHDMKQSLDGKSIGILPYVEGGNPSDRFIGTDSTRVHYF
jgi:hypothetical protein